MKKKIIWLILSCLMVAVLVLASCAPAVVEEEEVVTEEEVVEEEVVEEEKEMVVDVMGRLVEKPQYGGRATYAINSFEVDPVAGTPNSHAHWLCIQTLGTNDVLKGHTGSGEFDFRVTNSGPLEAYTGALAESWEQTDLTTAILHIREGVKWQNVPPANGREMTVDDVLYSIEVFQDNPRSNMYAPTEESRLQVRALDQHTIEITWSEPDAVSTLLRIIGFSILNKEVIEAYGGLPDALSDWKALIGTGPYIIKDVLPDSSCTWEKNPNYWQYDPFHPDNRLPYIDTLTGLVITDTATALAALRTGKLDLLQSITLDHKDSLVQTNPELLYGPGMAWDIHIYMRVDKEPFTDKRVRRALSMAIDQHAIAEQFYKGQAEIHMTPIWPAYGNMYTPYDELPDSTRELFEHHPDRAKELLAEAGYPDGFKTKVVTTDYYADVMSLVQEYLTEIGVDMEIKIVEPGKFWSILMGKQHEAMAFHVWGLANPSSAWSGLYAPGHVWNFSSVDDSHISEVWTEAKLTIDAEKRSQMLKDLGVYALDQVYDVPMPAQYPYNFWQPWLKGYDGEYFYGKFDNVWGVMGLPWVDQDLKYEMTGVRD